MHITNCNIFFMSPKLQEMDKATIRFTRISTFTLYAYEDSSTATK